MQTTRREINSFVAQKTFKYNDVINSKIVNLDIWYHFQLLDELNWKLELNSDLRSISSWVRRFNLSNWVESEDSIQVIKLNQNVDMKTRFNNQSKSYKRQEEHTLYSSYSDSTLVSKRTCWNIRKMFIWKMFATQRNVFIIDIY